MHSLPRRLLGRFALLAFGLSPGLELALPALAFVGFGSIGFLTTANSTLQLAVPHALLGRVMGIWVVLNAGTMPLGSLGLGAIADHSNVRVVVFIGAAAAFIAAWLMRPTPQPLT